MKRRSAGRAAVAATGLLLAGSALSCGVCIEDKIAVVYDDALVKRALERHHVVVFAEPVGPGPKAPALAALGAAAARSAGIVSGSIRTANEPAALAFALDPARQDPAAALARLERDAGLRGVKLSLLRVVR
jgi:hypothetical protein